MRFDIEYFNKEKSPEIRRLFYRRHRKIPLARLYIDFNKRTELHSEGSGPGRNITTLSFGDSEGIVTLYMCAEKGDIRFPNLYIKMYKDAAEVLFTRRSFLSSSRGLTSYWDYSWSIMERR